MLAFYKKSFFPLFIVGFLSGLWFSGPGAVRRKLDIGDRNGS